MEHTWKKKTTCECLTENEKQTVKPAMTEGQVWQYSES